MGKENRCSSQKAWSFLRISLLWARKGWISRKRVTEELRSLVIKHLKTLGHNRDQICYGERQLSFDETPIFHMKMHRPASMRFMIPCIKPPQNFDYDFNHEDDTYESGNGEFPESGDGYEKEDEKGIDMRAEEFISKFYGQIKLQRQISYLQHKGCITSEEQNHRESVV